MSNPKTPTPPTPRNPVARAAQTVAKGSGRHTNKMRSAKMGQTKHKGKMMDSVSSLDSRLITETLLIMEEFDLFEDDGVAASPRLQQAHQKERERRGLPDPDYYLKLKRQKEQEIAAMKAQDEAGKKDESIDEDWRKKLAAAGVAGMMGISGAAGAADQSSDTAANKIVATITIDGETRTLNLSSKNFRDVKEASKWLEQFLDQRGIENWSGKIERGVQGSGNYQRMKVDSSGAGGRS